MPRARKIIRPRKLTLHLPEDILGELDSRLRRPTDGKIPHSAYQVFFTERILEFFSQHPKEGKHGPDDASKDSYLESQVAQWGDDLIGDD